MRADRLRSPVCGQVPQACPSSVCGQGRRHLPPRGKAPRPGTLSTAKEPTPHAKIHRSAAQQLAQFFQVPPAHPRAGHPRPQGQIPPQCAGLYVEHFKPAAHDAAANARFLQFHLQPSFLFLFLSCSILLRTSVLPDPPGYALRSSR